jgi:dTDP-4-dehydrorhamnose reductase
VTGPVAGQRPAGGPPLTAPLILGATGLAGRRLLADLDGVALPVRVDASDWPALAAALERHAGPAIVNAIGLVKPGAGEPGPDPAMMAQINACLPHRLAEFARATGRRLVHLSSDCVFSGRQGLRRESDPADPIDLYGRTKLEGEVSGPDVVTLRTSFVGLAYGGPGQRSTRGLVEWFLAATGGPAARPVDGWTRALFSGVTTGELARAVGKVLAAPRADGLFHLAAAPISKHDLLAGLVHRLGRAGVVRALDTPVCDRSLDGSAFVATFGHAPPDWDTMLDALAGEIIARDRVDRGETA